MGNFFISPVKLYIGPRRLLTCAYVNANFHSFLCTVTGK